MLLAQATASDRRFQAPVFEVGLAGMSVPLQAPGPQFDSAMTGSRATHLVLKRIDTILKAKIGVR